MPTFESSFLVDYFPNFYGDVIPVPPSQNFLRSVQIHTMGFWWSMLLQGSVGNFISEVLFLGIIVF